MALTTPPERHAPVYRGGEFSGNAGRSSEPQGDGTRELLRWGCWTLAAGVLAALLTRTAFGGIGEQGPHTNSGWLSLIVAMMCLPFGFMLTALGGAKWLRNRSRPRSNAPDATANAAVDIDTRNHS